MEYRSLQSLGLHEKQAHTIVLRLHTIIFQVQLISIAAKLINALVNYGSVFQVVMLACMNRFLQVFVDLKKHYVVVEKTNALVNYGNACLVVIQVYMRNFQRVCVVRKPNQNLTQN